MKHLNDNLMQNLHHFSLMNYDEDIKLHKNELSTEKKEALIDKIVEECKESPEKENAELNKAIDKILIAHRNTKMFLFLMSWQFFVAYYVIKKIFQVLFVYYIWKKSKNV